MTGSSDRINRTGLTLAPGMAEDLVLGAHLTVPSSDGDAEAISAIRVRYAQEAEPMGSIPEPLGEDGAVRESEEAANPVLIDKLGERIAFERSGVRLYDALLSKYDAYGSWPGGPERAQLEAIRAQEADHFAMLGQSIAEIDGDPTSLTPSANLHGVASAGLRSVLADPRADLRQSLEAVLVAELTDHEGWENLVGLARALAQQELAERCDHALAQEREHLRQVREWLAAGISHAALGKLDPAFAASVRPRRAGNGQSKQTRGKSRVAARKRAAAKPKRGSTAARARKPLRPKKKSARRSA